MSQEAQKSNTIAIVVAILGVIGTVVASIIGATATISVEKIRQESALTQIALVAIATQGGATQVSMASTISAPTITPASLPTEIQAIPTVGSTNPVGIVQANSPISVDGFVLSFQGIFSAKGAGDRSNIGIKLRVKNVGDRDRVFRYTGNSITLRDDMGNTYPVYMLNGQDGSFECTPKWLDIQQLNIDTGGEQIFESAEYIPGCWYYEHSSLPQFTGQMSIQAQSFFIGFQDFGPFTGFEIEVKP